MIQKPVASFTILNEVDSTNNYAMAQVHAGMAKHGDAFFAHSQTSGKGQRGKSWQTGKGENIALSIVLVPGMLELSGQFRLSVAVSLACFEFFTKYAGDETKIKWPNDIYWRDRKAGGILIENVVGRQGEAKGSWKYAIAGIGININQTGFEDSIKNPVSLKQITGKDFLPEQLARELHQLVLNRVNELAGKDFDKMMQQYNNCLYKLNQPVQLKKGNIVFQSIIKSVTETGLLYTTDTIDNYFDFGEVEWIL
ncbi:MAG: biotin--[acetyl-CoA-carboxylase] ligase [Ferruginibacter sp.]